MKKFILSALFIGGAAAAANAQANSVLVYGDLGIHTKKDASDNKTLGFNINPGIGYQFNKHWTLGVAGGFATNRTKPDGADDWTYTNRYNAGVFVRHTMPVGRIFALFTQVEAGYMGQTAGVTDGASVNANGFYARLTPAVGVHVIDGFALNFGFGGIEFNTLKVSGASSATTSFDLTWGTQFNIGVSKNIMCGRHHKRHHGHMMNHGSKLDKQEIEEDRQETDEE